MLTPDQCLCFNLRRAARLATRAYDEALAPTGLTAAQYSALAMLSAAGPVPTGAFADAMALERTSLTRNLSLLERQGLISRKSGDDKRQRLVAITAKGRRIVEKASPSWRAAQQALLSALGSPKAGAVLTAAAAVEKALADQS